MGAFIIPGLPIREYVADRVPQAPGPTLSSHIATLLLTRSAAHAQHAHPILNPVWMPDDDRGFDVGVAAHAVILEDKTLAIIDADNYRTKAAQESRDAALLAGGIPALPHQAAAVKAMAERVRDRIKRCPDLEGVGELLPERTYLWREGETWLRCRPDWISADSRVIVSLKSTGACAEPNAFLRILLNSGYDVQSAFELAAVKAASGIDATYVWVVVETDPPYAVSLLGLSPMLYDLAHRKYERAVALWAQCMASGVWPSYPERICYVDPPDWSVSQWAERHMYATAGSVEDL